MPLTTPIARFNTIGQDEIDAAELVIRKYPLSGYLAGKPRGGYWVRMLEELWAGLCGTKHAIACNSATSGLMAASFACMPMMSHQDIAVPCFTMSATAAAPAFSCASSLFFMDCDAETYCSTPIHCPESHIGLIMVTNLFGQCAPLSLWRHYADRIGAKLIEDAAQAPFAVTEDGKLAGTVGDAGVFSFNVHKHLQVGEGGIVVTNDDQIAEDVRAFINHGECAGSEEFGLNLRMTEVCAAMAYHQARRSQSIIASRIALAEELSDMVKDFWEPPVAIGRHVYYHWAVRVPNRSRVIPYLITEGIPVRHGYVKPLYHLPAFQNEGRADCSVAEKAHEELMIFEICSWDPTKKQLEEMREIFKRAYEFANVEECPDTLS